MRLVFKILLFITFPIWIIPVGILATLVYALKFMWRFTSGMVDGFLDSFKDNNEKAIPGYIDLETTITNDINEILHKGDSKK